jgi:hypothetical protein
MQWETLLRRRPRIILAAKCASAAHVAGDRHARQKMVI